MNKQTIEIEKALEKEDVILKGVIESPSNSRTGEKLYDFTSGKFIMLQDIERYFNLKNKSEWRQKK